VVWLKVGNGLDSEAPRSATDIEKRVMRLEALAAEKIELQAPHFVPQAADNLALLAAGDTPCDLGFIVVPVVRHWRRLLGVQSLD
jgi:hypothetical protein